MVLCCCYCCCGTCCCCSFLQSLLFAMTIPSPSSPPTKFSRKAKNRFQLLFFVHTFWSSAFEPFEYPNKPFEKLRKILLKNRIYSIFVDCTWFLEHSKGGLIQKLQPDENINIQRLIYYTYMNK